MTKRFLMILVLSLLLSGNAYALKLSNCYYIKTSGDPELISTEFDKTRYEEWYYEIFQDGVQIVKVYTEKELQRLNEKAKEITGVFKFEKISTEQLKITFANDRVIKSSVITFRSERGIETRRRDTIDLKENTITTVAELKIPTKAGWSQDLEYIVKCNRSGSTSSGSDIASSGSGFFINNKGYFVTNYHVIEGCDDKSKIAYRKKEYPAELVASDKKADLAVLKAKVKNKEYLNFSYKPKKLLKVYVAGYPFGKMLSDDLNFHDGIISSLKGFEDNTNQITITAALNPGNSGGPVVNENGEVVGVAVSGLAKDLTEGINFAIKSETVQTFLKSNKIKLSSSFYNKKLDSDDLLELLEEGTVYTFCN